MRTFFSVVAVCLLFSCVQVARAQPQIPATFYGSASVDGEPVPDGTEVRAFVDGQDCTQLGPAYQGTVTDAGVAAFTIVVMHESQQAGCGTEGKTVTFTIGGREAEQTAAWTAGPQRIDLNAGSGEPLELPTPTPTPTPAPGEPTLTPTQAAAAADTPALLTGTPPTDLIELPQTPRPPGDVSLPPGLPDDSGGDDNGGGTPLWLIVAVALLVIGAGGGVAGYLLSRRGGTDSR